MWWWGSEPTRLCPKVYEALQKKIYENNDHSVAEASILPKLRHKTPHSPRTLEGAGSYPSPTPVTWRWCIEQTFREIR